MSLVNGAYQCLIYNKLDIFKVVEIWPRRKENTGGWGKIYSYKVTLKLLFLKTKNPISQLIGRTP